MHAAVALRHLELFEAWDVLANVRERSDELRNLLQSKTGLSLASSAVFDYPTIGELAEHLVSQLPDSDTPSEEGEPGGATGD